MSRTARPGRSRPAATRRSSPTLRRTRRTRRGWRLPSASRCAAADARAGRSPRPPPDRAAARTTLPPAACASSRASTALTRMPERRVVERQAPRQADQPGLRGGVRKHAGDRQRRVDRRDVDDRRRGRAALHARQHVLRAQPRAFEIDGEHAIPFRLGHLVASK